MWNQVGSCSLIFSETLMASALTLYFFAIVSILFSSLGSLDVEPMSGCHVWRKVLIVVPLYFSLMFFIPEMHFSLSWSATYTYSGWSSERSRYFLQAQHQWSNVSLRLWKLFPFSGIQLCRLQRVLLSILLFYQEFYSLLVLWMFSVGLTVILLQWWRLGVIVGPHDAHLISLPRSCWCSHSEFCFFTSV